jgi:hypothetical protein
MMACGAGPPGAPKNKGLMPEPLEPLPLPCATNTPTHQHTNTPLRVSPSSMTARLGFIRRLRPLEDTRVGGSDARKRTSSPGRKPIQEAPTLDLRECYREVPERRFDRRTITASNHDLGSLGDCRGTLLARRVAIFERNINPGAAGGMGSETK